MQYYFNHKIEKGNGEEIIQYHINAGNIFIFYENLFNFILNCYLIHLLNFLSVLPLFSMYC